MDANREVWKEIPGSKGYYEASSHGRIKSNREGLIMRTPCNSHGYPVVRLYIPGKGDRLYRVHRLVAFAFLGPRPRNIHVNHIDGVKHNNHLSNLEYVTASENHKHAYRAGLVTPHTVCPRHAKVTPDDVRSIRRLRKVLSLQHLAKRFGVTPVAIHRIITRKTWAHVA